MIYLYTLEGLDSVYMVTKHVASSDCLHRKTRYDGKYAPIQPAPMDELGRLHGWKGPWAWVGICRQIYAEATALPYNKNIAYAHDSGCVDKITLSEKAGVKKLYLTFSYDPFKYPRYVHYPIARLPGEFPNLHHVTVHVEDRRTGPKGRSKYSEDSQELEKIVRSELQLADRPGVSVQLETRRLRSVEKFFWGAKHEH